MWVNTRMVPASSSRICCPGDVQRCSPRRRRAQRDRPPLPAALDYLGAGDTLTVWQLDPLARYVRQLVETAEDLAKREIELRVLTYAIDTTGPGGRLAFHVFAAWRSSSAS